MTKNQDRVSTVLIRMAQMVERDPEWAERFIAPLILCLRRCIAKMISGNGANMTLAATIQWASGGFIIYKGLMGDKKRYFRKTT